MKSLRENSTSCGFSQRKAYLNLKSFKKIVHLGWLKFKRLINNEFLKREARDTFLWENAWRNIHLKESIEP